MSFSFSSLIRLIVLGAVGSTMLAVGVSRLDPPKPGWRARRPASHMFVNDYFLETTDRMPHWLDVDTGGVATHPLAGDGLLEAATCSPWVDAEGRRQVVGRWSSLSREGPMSISRDFGLARYTFPGGELIEQVSTEIVPAGPCCWFPGTRARVLFTAGDGMLYHYAFEPEPWVVGQPGHGPGGDPRPRPLAWRCPKPGSGEVFLADLSWPEDPRMGGCVLVTLRDQVLDEQGDRRFSQTQTWWLKLNHAGTAIIEAGRLVDPDRGGTVAGDLDERCPVVGTLPDGRLALAYLRQHSGKNGWEMTLAPIRFEGEARTPTTSVSTGRVLADHCLPFHPAFSSDGRWLNLFAGPTLADGKLVRVPVGDASLVASRP